jgi:hypothetical protein
MKYRVPKIQKMWCRRLRPALGRGACICPPPVSLALHTIWKAADVILGVVLIVPLWKSAKLWTFAFDDGRHLNRVFAGMQIVRMRALAWEITARDRMGGHELQFLVLCFKEGKVERPLESLQGEGRCFRILFNNSCECSKIEPSVL